MYADDVPDAFEGLVTRFNRIYIDRDPKEVSESYLRSFDRFSQLSECDECNGTRYRPDVLEHKVDGRTIADVLALTAEEAAAQIDIPSVAHRAQTIVEVGLGYLTLGQPLSTLSGGQIMFTGAVSDLLEADTPTAVHLKRAVENSMPLLRLFPQVG